jgi:hypothetical protein
LACATRSSDRTASSIKGGEILAALFLWLRVGQPEQSNAVCHCAGCAANMSCGKNQTNDPIEVRIDPATHCRRCRDDDKMAQGTGLDGAAIDPR